VSGASSAASAERLSDDALIEFGRASMSRHLDRRDTTGLVAGTFVLAAIACALLLPSHRPLSIEALAASILCYSLASRIQFEFVCGYTMPTEGIFVAMWFLLPPSLLPAAVCCGLILGGLPELVARRKPVDRLALNVIASWHALGPALVFAVARPPSLAWSALPVCIAALAAQVAFDFTSSYIVTRPVVEISPRAQLIAMAPIYAADVMLAPLGVLAAYPASRNPWALLALLPVLALFSTFAKERQARIDNALELSSAYRGTAMLLGDVIEADDAYTGSHSRDVVGLALDVADRLGLEHRERQQVELAALLHDVGKVKVPAEIVNKQGPLDDDEWAVMRTHTVLGEEMLDQVGGLLGEVGRVVRSCHERWDGGGYPDGVAGEEIPLAARIVCCCDAWSAMTTDRSYRRALPEADALAELRRCRGTHFDPRVVDALLAVLRA